MQATAAKGIPVVVNELCYCVITFSTLHGLNEDASTVGKYPVPTTVAVLTVHHRAQRMGYLKQLLSGLMMLLQ